MLKPKALVTGGTGYLGARIGVYLAAHGYDVSLGSRKPFSQRIIHGCSQISTDWEDPKLAFCDGFDLIVHAAGMNALDCANNPQLAIEFNGKITDLLVKKSASYGCKQFFYLSTMHVYRNPLVGQLSEDSPAVNCHPYATSQRYGEKAVLNAIASSSLKGSVLRLSNCFGAPVTNSSECWKLVLNQFVREAYTTGTITINGNYLSKRDFLPIAELNKVFLKILDYKNSLPSIINVSSGKANTLDEVANVVSVMTSKITKKKISIHKNENYFTEEDLYIENKALKSMGIYVCSDWSGEIMNLISDVSQRFNVHL